MSVSFVWPDEPLPHLTGLPVLHVLVTTPRNQADLHRNLAAVGYTVELVSTDEGGDHWRFVHPDGEKP